MNCYACTILYNCVTSLCPQGPLMHIRLDIDMTKLDPNFPPDADGVQPIRYLHAGDIIAIEANEGWEMIEKGLAKLYEHKEEL